MVMDKSDEGCLSRRAVTGGAFQNQRSIADIGIEIRPVAIKVAFLIFEFLESVHFLHQEHRHSKVRRFFIAIKPRKLVIVRS